MSAYPAAPPAAYGYAIRKPTDVMGRRVGAYLLNGLIGAAVVAGLFFAVFLSTKPYKSVSFASADAASNFCSLSQSERDDRLQDRYRDRICVNIDNHVYLVEPGPAIGTGIGLWVAWAVVNYVLLEGLTGASVGKAIVGLRVMRGNGSKPGIGWAALRTLLLWIPDGLFAGIVGLIVALTNDNHQRVGDMAAGTYVVEKRAAGYPLQQAPLAYPPYGTPAASPPGSYGAPPVGPLPPQPGYGPSAPSPEPAAAPPASEVAVAEPQWDPARNTYIWWNAETQQWLEHDPATGEWRPISQ